MAMTSSRKAVVTLPTDTQILITREFDAPRHLVYQAYTTPELIKRWWSGDRGEVTSVEVDLRVGGVWRYVMTANGGFEVGFHGTFREIVPNERIVSSEIYEGMPDAEAVDTATFTESARNQRRNFSSFASSSRYGVWVFATSVSCTGRRR